MSSIVDPEPEHPAEELVAYLDGELAPEECRLVEERLAADPKYRQQLHDLDQAWEALDALPPTKADDDFARTTMELLTVAAAGDASQESARAVVERRKRTLRWVAAGVAAAVLGFILARSLVPSANRALLADLPVIRQIDLLTPIEDVEFLRQLSNVPIGRLISDESAVRKELAQIQSASAPSPDARRRWIEDLPPDERTTLAAQARRFGDRSKNEQRRLRDLDHAIDSAADADVLRKNLVAYGQWFARLAPGQQEQLRVDLEGLASTEQIDRVRRVDRQASNQALRHLSTEEVENLRAEALAIASDRRSLLLNELHRRGNASQQLEGPRGTLMILNRELRDDNDNSTRDRLVNQLSRESREHLDRMPSWARRAQLWQWLRDALHHQWRQGELESFFAEKLDNHQRERLLSLPPAEMQAQLERLYLASQLGYRDDGPGGNEFRDPRGRPRNPPEGDLGPWLEGPPRDSQPRDRFERPDRNRRRGLPPRDDFPENRRRPPPPGSGGPPPGPLPRDREEPKAI